MYIINIVRNIKPFLLISIREGPGGPRGAILRWRSGRAVVRRYPSSKIRSSGCALLENHEEIPHAQGKRNPSKTVDVARGHQKADTLKPYSQKTNQSNRTRTTALSNSMKLSHAPGATQDGRVIVERYDRMWSTGEGNGKPLQYSYFFFFKLYTSVFLPWEPHEKYEKEKW